MSFVANLAARVPHTSFWGKVIRSPLRLIPNNVVVPVLGDINRGKRWITGAGVTHTCWMGSYEIELVWPGMVVYDVGANAGYYTLALSRLAGDSGRVYAFEPNAKYTHFLRLHIELNGIHNVTLVQAAVSDSVGLIGFTGWMVTEASSYVVPSISLDSFLAAGNPLPSFIKMDIEGGEEAALKGARDLLAKAKLSWLLATSSEELRIFCRSFLAQYDYQFASFACISDPGIAGDFIVLPAPS